MTDKKATPEQIEGHEYLVKHLGLRVTSGLSFDFDRLTLETAKEIVDLVADWGRTTEVTE